MYSTLIDDETIFRAGSDGTFYRVQFHRDDDTQDPWKTNEGMVHRVTKNGADDKDANPWTFLDKPAHWFKMMRFAILAATENACWNFYGPANLDQGIWDESGFDEDHDDFDEACRVFFTEWPVNCGNEFGKWDDVIAVLTLGGCLAEEKSARGYSQGDWTGLLLVVTPEQVKEWGFEDLKAFEAACPKWAENAANQYGAWAYGGVIGYQVNAYDAAQIAEHCKEHVCTIEDIDANDLEDVDEIDACWGFYPVGSSDHFPLTEVHSDCVNQALGNIPQAENIPQIEKIAA